MSTITDEQFEDIVLSSSPKVYAKFCRKELPIYLGLSVLNAIFVMFSQMVDVTIIFTISLGALLSFLIQGAYLIRFRSQVIVPFRLTYSLPRKLVSSWTLGLGYGTIFLILQKLQFIPFVGALAPIGGAVLIAFNTVVAYRYHRWQFLRQDADKSLHPMELLFVSLITLFFGVVIVLFASMLFALGMVLECALEPTCSVMEMILAPINWLLDFIGLGTVQ